MQCSALFRISQTGQPWAGGEVGPGNAGDVLWTGCGGCHQLESDLRADRVRRIASAGTERLARGSSGPKGRLGA